MDKCVDSLGDGQLCSTMDAASGSAQINMDKFDKKQLLLLITDFVALHACHLF